MGATSAPAPARGSKLTISFGLVNVGVKFAPLVRSERTKGRMLCSEHGQPIKSQTYCEICDGAVETVTGYEFGGGFVVLQDRKALESTRDGVLELRAFVDVADIDPLYVEKTHLLWPQDGQEAGYDLLRDLLYGSGKAVVGTTVLSKSTKAIVIRVSNGVLVAHVCTYDANVAWNDVALVNQREAKETPKAMLDAARTLFSSLDEQFDFATVEDEYELRLREAIEAQADGRVIAKVEAPEAAPVVDLMAALTASVAAAKEGDKPKARRKKVAA